MQFAHGATFGDQDHRTAKDATGKLNSSRCDTWNEPPRLQGRMKSAAVGSWAGMIPSTVKYTSKLAASGPGSFHVLDEAKARRMNAKTLYIPSVEDVVSAIRAIPKGTVVASEEVRKSIAEAHGADSCCPGKFKCYWQWSAFAMEFEGGPELPWWRMTKAGGAYAQMPGGAAGHAGKMASEKEL